MIVGLAVGLLAGAIAMVRGGRMPSLLATEFLFLPILFMAFAVQLGFEIWDPDSLSPSGQLVMIVATSAAVAVFLFLNRQLPGTILAGVGLLLNVVVIAANGSMPVSIDAARVAGITESLDSGVQHEPMTEDSLLPWLADIIPIPDTKLVISIGDVVLGAGIGVLVYNRALATETQEARRASG